MKLVIFGANGPVGVLLTQAALDEGHTVTAVTRRPDAFPIASERLKVVRGDVFNEAEVKEAVAGQDAVLSTFGVPYTREPVTVYSVGITKILAAMRSAKVRRLVAVTSGGTNPRRDLSEGLIWSLIIKPFFGKTLYADMRRMEEIVFASDVDWTIVRPARLVDTPTVTSYRYAETYVMPGLSKTSRRDLADFMLRHVASDELVGKAVALGTQV
ncbi:MAG: SDR family oxidoreductase [Myxococcales bacterium]|nr:SDR family oxidoreductase [Myxococcales bacterium]